MFFDSCAYGCCRRERLQGVSGQLMKNRRILANKRRIAFGKAWKRRNW